MIQRSEELPSSFEPIEADILEHIHLEFSTRRAHEWYVQYCTLKLRDQTQRLIQQHKPKDEEYRMSTEQSGKRSKVWHEDSQTSMSRGRSGTQQHKGLRKSGLRL